MLRELLRLLDILAIEGTIVTLLIRHLRGVSIQVYRNTLVFTAHLRFVVFDRIPERVEV